MTRDLSGESARLLGAAVAIAAQDFAELADLILETPSVLNRFESTGILKTRSCARAVGRRSGCARQRSQTRCSARSSLRPLPHDWPLRFPITVAEMCWLAPASALKRRPFLRDSSRRPSKIFRPAQSLFPCPGRQPLEGFSAVESPRGELLYCIRVLQGRIQRCHIKSPSFQNWPALPLAMPGNIIADFPLINKSFNLSYSGCDR